MNQHPDIAKVLLTEETIQQRIECVAEEILEFYAGEEFTVVSLLKGALFFTADLCRLFPAEVELSFLHASSYQGGTETSGKVQLGSIPVVKGKRVLLVDDIYDTGITLDHVSNTLLSAGATEVRTCVLLSKKKQHTIDVQVDFSCFAIENEFVVGYGLDFQEKFRTLPYVGVLKDPAYL